MVQLNSESHEVLVRRSLAERYTQLVPTAPSLDGRVFADVSERSQEHSHRHSDERSDEPEEHPGDVDSETRFEYHEEHDGIVWARYAGGSVRLGYLVGRRDGDFLEFRYSHVTTTGATANGHCRSDIVVRADGLIEFHERWEWESQPGRGESIVRELPT